MRGLLDATAWFYGHVQEAAQIVSSESRTPPQFALRACERLIAKNVIPHDLRISLPALDRAVDAMRESGQIPAETTLPSDIFETRWLDRAETL
jgi:hypothetical protein